MNIAYIIFNGITWLDMIGVYEPVSKLKTRNYLPSLSWDICSFSETAEDAYGLTVKPGKIQNDLKGYDAIIVAGGIGTRTLKDNPEFIRWLQTAAPCKYKISICTGSLLLGAAGFLRGKKATTNFQEYEALKPYCENVVEQRIVEDGDTITAGAVTSSIDLGLYLCRLWAGDEASADIRRRIDYRG